MLPLVNPVTRRLGPVTVESYLALPEERRRAVELIDGELVPRGAPTGEHGGVQAGVTILLGGRYGRRPTGGPPERPGGWWFATEVDVQFGEQVLRPDVLAWRRERVPQRPAGAPVTVLPDWTCEVLSTNRVHDVVLKKRIYHAHRVPHYWILDPGEGTLLVYRWSAEGYVEVVAAQRSERVRAEPFDAVELAAGALFGDDEE